MSKGKCGGKMEYLLDPIKINEYLEETIILEDLNEIYKYSLSNNLDCIKDAIKKRTGHTIDLCNVKWKINLLLSDDVKILMNKHNVDYSMTLIRNKKVNYIIINMRAGNNKWLLTGYEKINNNYYSFSTIESFIQFSKILDTYISDYD